MSNKIAVFSADDHSMMREGVASVINAQPDMCLVAQASTGSQAIKHFREYKADVTLMDLRLLDISGIETMQANRIHVFGGPEVILFEDVPRAAQLVPDAGSESWNDLP